MDLASFLPKPKKQENTPTVTIAENPVSTLSLVNSGSSKAILTSTIQLDNSAPVSVAEAIAQQGHWEGRMVKATLADQKPLARPTKFLKPPLEERERRLHEVKSTLEAILGRRIEAVQGRGDQVMSRSDQLLEYRPEREGDMTRVIRLVEAPRDPLQPPRFHHSRAPRPPVSPPAPVLHSPPRKATVAEQRAWQIPPCVSNWINPAGYTIPLDKRLAADGRGLQEVALNPRHASMAEALYMAESNAKQEVERRAAVEAMLEGEERAKKEENLRRMADQARQERLALIKTMRQEEERAEMQGYRRDSRDDERREKDRRELRDYPPRDHWESREYDQRGTSRYDDRYHRRDSRERERRERSRSPTLREREYLRKKLEFEMEKELKLAKMRPEQRDRHLHQDREVSERVALGRMQPRLEGEALFDQRLFDRSAGLGSGLMGEDATMLYDQPLFKTNLSQVIYRPRANAGDNADAEESEVKGLGSHANTVRRGPVEFEPAKPKADDPFGLDSFLQETQRPK